MPTKPGTTISYSSQEIDNLGFDTDYNVPVSEAVGHDGQGLQRLNADNLAVKVTTSGSDTFIGQAAPGTPQSSALWQAMKIDVDGNVTWADKGNFTQVATDLTALSYA